MHDNTQVQVFGPNGIDVVLNIAQGPV
jgi:hypothetical protein